MSSPVQTFALERAESPTGRLLVLTDDQHRLRAVDWEDHEPRMRRLLRQQYGADAVRLCAVSGRSNASLALDAYFEGDFGAFGALTTATAGTVFQRLVWNALSRIGAGTTTSYGALAAALGKPAASRAVGHANGANPIAIVVPCHRVIGSNRALTGFGGGLERKSWLLAHEGAGPCRCDSLPPMALRDRSSSDARLSPPRYP